MAELSAYEQNRLDNIRRNEEFLRSLGLIDSSGNSTTVIAKDAEFTAAVKPSRPAKKTKRASDRSAYAAGDAGEVTSMPTAPRRSSRLKNEASSELQLLQLNDYTDTSTIRRKSQDIVMEPNGYISRESEDDDVEFDSKKRRRQEDDEKNSSRVLLTTGGLREFINNRSKAHSAMVSDKAIAHCIYRCSYMSSNALKSRIKSICRGHGAASKEKLIVFAYALLAMGLERKAELASTAVWNKTRLRIVADAT